MQQHVILFGWDGFSERLFLELNRSEIPVGIAAVDSADSIRDRYGHLEDVDVLEMSSFEAVGQLDQLDASEAARFFVNLDSDEQKLLRVVDIAERPDWTGDIDVVLEHERLEDTFRDAGVRYAVSRRDISSKLLATYIYEPDVAEATERLFTSTHSGSADEVSPQNSPDPTGASDPRAQQDVGIQELQVGSDCQLPDQSPIGEQPYLFGDIVAALRGRFGAVPLAIYTGSKLQRLPDADTTVDAGDYLLIALSRQHESDIRTFLDTSSEGRLHEHSDS
jgi:voltage-gated potassium channel